MTEPDAAKPSVDAPAGAELETAPRPGKRGPIFRVTLEGTGDAGRDVLALRLILKALWRRHGFRCVGVREE